MPRDKPKIQLVAPTTSSTDGTGLNPKTWPDEPPPPLDIPSRPPMFRPLKVYAFGPSLGREPGNIRTIAVRYEKLATGPVGERISVVDYDATRECFYDPVDLDDPHIAINGGLDPSESDPHFHQQMVYAVASESLRRVEVALGRIAQSRSPTGAEPLRFVFYPHANVMANAHSIGNRLMFGYFSAPEIATGRVVPRQTIFTCLSHDVIVHQIVHVMLHAMRPDLDMGLLDNMSLQETMADLTPLLFHFTYREVVLDTIQRTAGVIYSSHLDVDRDSGGAPRILAELASDNPLLALSQDFGDAIGLSGGIRNAVVAPNPKALAAAHEPHQRGSIVTSAVFDAMFSIYQRRTIDLFRIYRAGGGHLQGNDVPEPLAARLCDEVERVAARVFNMCWRAIDYVPAGYSALGDFLRACITADYEYTREDAWGLRDAMMQAFRLRGIQPSDAPFFSEDTLRWPVMDTSKWKRRALDPAKVVGDAAAEEVRGFIEQNASALGLNGKLAFSIYPLETARLTAPDDTPHSTLTTQVIQGPKLRGATLVFDGAGRLRYAIPTSPTPKSKKREPA